QRSHVPPFPTRRSSDLIGRGRPKEPRRADCVDERANESSLSIASDKTRNSAWRRGYGKDSVGSGESAKARERGISNLTCLLQQSDRKSTRLNSSHEWIS